MFSRNLTLSACDERRWKMEKTERAWIFRDDQIQGSYPSNASKGMSGVVVSSNAEVRLALPQGEESIHLSSDLCAEGNLPLLKPGDEVIETLVLNDEEINLDEESLAKAHKFVEHIEGKFKCSLCGFFSDEINGVYNHLVPAHGEDWKKSSDQVNTSVLVENSRRGNVHLDPNWKKNLKLSFLKDVVPKWSQLTLNAWTSNKEIMDPKTFRKVRAEIKDDLVDHILKFFGTTKTPSLKILEEIVTDVLSASYPFMFSQSDGSASTIPTLNYGRGLGGIKGVINLPSQLWDAIYSKQMKLRTEENKRRANESGESENEIENCRPKKGKKRVRQGN